MLNMGCTTGMGRIFSILYIHGSQICRTLLNFSDFGILYTTHICIVSGKNKNKQTKIEKKKQDIMWFSHGPHSKISSDTPFPIPGWVPPPPPLPPGRNKDFGVLKAKSPLPSMKMYFCFHPWWWGGRRAEGKQLPSLTLTTLLSNSKFA